MKHEHYDLISQWNDDNSIQFEFAYGTGVDFIWSDCNINYVISNPSAQIRVKDESKKKEKHWIVAGDNSLHTMMYFHSKADAELYNSNGANAQVIEIEVEVK